MQCLGWWFLWSRSPIFWPRLFSRFMMFLSRHGFWLYLSCPISWRWSQDFGFMIKFRLGFICFPYYLCAGWIHSMLWMLGTKLRTWLKGARGVLACGMLGSSVHSPSMYLGRPTDVVRVTTGSFSSRFVFVLRWDDVFLLFPPPTWNVPSRWPFHFCSMHFYCLVVINIRL